MITTKNSKIESNKTFEHSPDSFQCGALVTNAANIIIYVNSYFTDELLWNPEQLIGKNADIIFTQSPCVRIVVASINLQINRER
jgi:PAS domain-containing protein